MGRYATVAFEDSSVEFKFVGLIAQMAYDVGVVCNQDDVTLSFEDISRMVDRLHLYPITQYPTEAYYVGMLMAWYGMHNPGDELTFG
jgi:hypothetical protein